MKLLCSRLDSIVGKAPVMKSPGCRSQRTKPFVLLALSFLVAVFAFSWNKIKEDAAYVMGIETYVYGYPLVVMDLTREVLTAAPGPNAAGTAAPINQLAKTPRYLSPYFKNIARISLNSLWTMGWLDLEKEPMVLSVPETRGRYYVFSVMNMWTDVFASIGKRTTGTAPGNFLIAGPNWNGPTPSNIKQTFRSSTKYAWILGQTQTNGPGDFAAVNAIQAEYRLTPLSAYGKPYSPPTNVPVDSHVDLKTTPPNQVARMDAGTFFKRLAALMKDNPPGAADRFRVWMLRQLGVQPGQDFDFDKIDPAVARGLNLAVKEALMKLAEGVTKADNVNGWIQPPDLGRYGTDFNTRAVVALVGPGVDLPEDTIYPIAFVDDEGNPLDSANRYLLHYNKDKLPPTNAAWSIALYQGANPVLNPLERFVIAPWMPLRYYPDGSLDIYIQRDSPGKDNEANWLPAPIEGEFNVIIRNYWPKEEAINGIYKNPPLRRH